MLATSSTRALGRTLMTAQTITSAAFMSHTPLVRRYMEIGTSAPPLNGFAGRGASRVLRRSHNSRANRPDLAKLDRPMRAPDPTHNPPGSRTGRNTSGDDEAKQHPKEPFHRDRVRGQACGAATSHRYGRPQPYEDRSHPLADHASSIRDYRTPGGRFRAADWP